MNALQSRTRFRSLVLCVLLIFGLPTSATAAPQPPPDEVLVAVVTDKTNEGTCKLLVQDAAVAKRQTATELNQLLASAPNCPPGSVFEIKVMKLKEAMLNGIRDYVILTHNEKQDRDAIAQLEEKIRQRDKGYVRPSAPTAIQSCTAANKITTAARTLTNPFGSQDTTFTQFSYTVASSCFLSNMKDRGKHTNSGMFSCWWNTRVQQPGTTGSFNWPKRPSIDLGTTYSAYRGMNEASGVSVGWRYTFTYHTYGDLYCLDDQPGTTYFDISYTIPN